MHQEFVHKNSDKPDLEILDLVDENDCVIGQIPREQWKFGTECRIRSIHVLIKNSRGQLWIPRRHLSKKTLPGCLDFSASGCVQSGESYEEAFAREVLEELNLNIHDCVWRKLAHLKPHIDQSHAFSVVYEISSDIEPRFNESEYEAGTWMFPQEVVDLVLKSDERTKKDFIMIIQKLYLV